MSESRDELIEAVFGPLNAVERANAPARIYFDGDISLLQHGTRIAVVGTRKPSDLGIRRTQQLVDRLVAREITVVSGLALGIDTVAHQQTLDRKGRTIAVLGTALTDTHPKQNRSLQARLATDHLVVSEFPPGHPTVRTNFPRRNRTMALLSDATIIVEAGDGSGTLHQGWEALRLGRPLFLLKSLVERTDLQWPTEMIRYGAQTLSNDNLEIVLTEIPRRVREEVSF